MFISLGTEFMCDFCELVFTSKEKLDTHQATIHEEEMQSVSILYLLVYYIYFNVQII